MNSSQNSGQREQLLSQLQLVFANFGYDGATLSRLSTATGLSKASLYHHFPGGKTEIAQILVRRCVSEFQRHSFANFTNDHDPIDRLKSFVDGFSHYIDQSGHNCLLMALNQGSTQDSLGAEIASQFQSWTQQLADTFAGLGLKDKRAQRESQQLLAQLYGQLTVSKLTGNPAIFNKALKRIQKNFERTFG